MTTEEQDELTEKMADLDKDGAIQKFKLLVADAERHARAGETLEATYSLSDLQSLVKGTPLDGEEVLYKVEARECSGVAAVAVEAARLFKLAVHTNSFDAQAKCQALLARLEREIFTSAE